MVPQAGAAKPRVTPEDYGAGVFDAIGQLASGVHREKVEDYKIDRQIEANRQWTDFQTEFATLREDMAAQSREARQEFRPDHAEALGKEYAVREQALLAGIKDEQVRSRAKVSLASWGSGYRSGEADWAQVRSGEVATENFRNARDASANRTRRLEQPGDYAAEMVVQLEAIDGLSVSDKIKEGLKEETGQVLAVAYLQGRIDEDPRLAKAMLDSGAFDEVLTPPQVEALLNGANVEIRRFDAAAERAKSVAAAEFRQDMKLFREESGQGLDRSDQIAGLRARAEALGLEAEMAELDGAAADSVFARVYEGAPPVQLEQRMAALRAKDKPSDAEARELKWIEGHLPGIESRYAKDPVGFYAREGGDAAPPAIDFNDPASIAARSRWALAASEASGRPVPMLSKAEASQLAQNYESGRVGEEGVLALLNRLPPAQAMEAARMIDPGNPTLPIIATLPQQYRNIARRGREALKANKALLSDPIKADLDLEGEIETLRRQFDRALASVPPDQRNAIRATAEEIAAGYLDKHGATINGQIYETALNQAMGAYTADGVWKGGFTSWNERWFLLPADVSKDGFKSAVQRQLAASDNPPVNPDGSPANIYRAWPVAVGPGLYEFHTGAGDPLRVNDGAPWRVRVKAQ